MLSNCKSCGGVLNLDSPVCEYCGIANPNYVKEKSIRIDICNRQPNQLTYTAECRIPKEYLLYNPDGWKKEMKHILARQIAEKIVEDHEIGLNNLTIDPLDNTLKVGMNVTVLSK